MPILVLLILSAWLRPAEALAPRQLEFYVGQRTFRLEEPATGSPEREAYEGMSSEEKIAFHRKRRGLLKVSAQALQYTRFGFGMGAVLGHKARFAINRLRGKKPDPDRETANINLREHAEQIVQLGLELIDSTIWKDAPLFAHSNEYGVVGAIGGQYIHKSFDHQRGGLIDLGFTLAYNREENSLAFQLFYEREILDSSILPALLLTGANLKAGVFIANHEHGEFSHEGQSIYAPPGAPTFMTHSSRDAMAGFSSGGPLTFPPSPIGDLVTNINRVERTYLYRGTISPSTPGFVRVHRGHWPEHLKVAVEPASRAARHIWSWLARKAADCRALLTAQRDDDPLP